MRTDFFLFKAKVLIKNSVKRMLKTIYYWGVLMKYLTKLASSVVLGIMACPLVSSAVESVLFSNRNNISGQRQIIQRLYYIWFRRHNIFNRYGRQGCAYMENWY